MVQTLFRGETLRSILLNAYGWWTVGTITLWAGFASVLAGCCSGSSRSSASGTPQVAQPGMERTTTIPELADATN